MTESTRPIANRFWSFSGVLGASLERSRQKWLNEGIFEKYWTKPIKKKNAPEVQGPSKETMVKLGSCTINIEPHAFEATLYTVKAPEVTFLPPMSVPPPRLLPQHGPVSSQLPPLQGNLNTLPQPSMPTQAPTFTNSTTPNFLRGPAVQPRSLLNSRPTPNSASATPVPAQGPLGAVNGTPAQAQQPGPKQNPDPVIQMLATKAATDQDLKALMRVVASGKASQSELRVFQGHIDELNKILQTRSHANRPLAPSPSTASPALPGTPVADPYSMPVSQHTPRDVTLNAPGFSSTSAPIKTEPLTAYYSEPSPMVRSKGLPPIKPDISAVVFEFTASTGVRYLFPKYSVLEYLPGGTRVIASFLVVRKGATGNPEKYDPKLEYYQPVTMSLTASHARLLEPLARVVAPLEEVRKHMNEIMDKMSRAKDVYLPLRLPRAPDDIIEDEENDTMESGGVDGIQAIYAPPSAVVPLQKHSK